MSKYGEKLEIGVEICEISEENSVKGLLVALYLLKGAELAGVN